MTPMKMNETYFPFLRVSPFSLSDFLIQRVPGLTARAFTPTPGSILFPSVAANHGLSLLNVKYVLVGLRISSQKPMCDATVSVGSSRSVASTLHFLTEKKPRVENGSGSRILPMQSLRHRSASHIL